MGSKETTETIKVVVYNCDVCGKTLDRVNRCHICEKDLCYCCTTYDDRDCGDYPTKYCDQCWDIGKPYREKMATIENESDEKICKLNAQWKNEAMKGD